MASTAPALGAFPSPFSIETPPGCEGWEEMYPYYALFDERRRDSDENRFWFWNSMHFPVPMPAFDAICIDSPYQAVGAWQNRVFAVPPAMGIDYRIVNGYVYISGNPVTDPAKMAERAEFFSEARRALLRQLGRAVRQVAQQDGGADRRARRAAGSRPARIRARRDRVRRRPQHRVLRGAGLIRAGAAPRRPDVAEPLRVPAARLRRLRDVRRLLQGPPARHPRSAHRPDGRRDRRVAVQARRRASPACAAGDRHRRRRSVRRGAHARGDRRRAVWQRGRSRLARRARARQGPVVQHGHRRRPLPLLPQLARRPEHSVRVADRPRRRAARRESRSTARPRRSSANATAWRRSTGRCSTRMRAGRSTSCSACRGWCSPTSRSTSSSATTGS